MGMTYGTEPVKARIEPFVIAFMTATIRDAPSTKGKALGRVTRGTRLTFAGLTSGNWYMVEYKGDTAWVCETQSILIE